MKIIKLAIAIFTIFFVSYQSFAQIVCVNSKTVNIRWGAGTKDKIRWQAFENTPLQVIGEKGSWYHVIDYAGYIGWVHKWTVSKRRCVIVKKPVAFVHFKSSASSYIAWQVDGEFPFKVSKVEGSWVRVDGYENTIGWIHIDNLWGI